MSHPPGSNRHQIRFFRFFSGGTERQYTPICRVVSPCVKLTRPPSSDIRGGDAKEGEARFRCFAVTFPRLARQTKVRHRAVAQGLCWLAALALPGIARGWHILPPTRLLRALGLENAADGHFDDLRRIRYRCGNANRQIAAGDSLQVVDNRWLTIANSPFHGGNGGSNPPGDATHSVLL